MQDVKKYYVQKNLLIMKHAKIFKRLLKQASISQAWLCKKSGMHPSKINRFLNGVADINSAELFQLLDLMPKEFQKRYWQLVIDREFCGNDQKMDAIQLVEMVRNLSPADQITVMQAIVEEEEIFKRNENKNDTDPKLARNSA